MRRSIKLLPLKSRVLVYDQHVTTGTDLFNAICEQDIPGIVAKQAAASYTPDATTWVKIKNRRYSLAVERRDFFDRRRAVG